MLVLGLTTQSGIYRTVLVLHILCAIVGFGSVMLNAVYGAESKKRPGPEGIAVFDANHRVSTIVHGGFIQLSGLYALASAWTAIDPSAFRTTRRSAGGR